MPKEKQYPRYLGDGRVLVQLVPGQENSLTREEVATKLSHLQEAFALFDAYKRPYNRSDWNGNILLCIGCTLITSAAYYSHGDLLSYHGVVALLGSVVVMLVIGGIKPKTKIRKL